MRECPPIPPPGRESVIKWRDVRSVRELRAFLVEYNMLEEREKEIIMLQMYGYLDNIKQTYVKITPQRVEERPFINNKGRRTRRRR